MAVVDEASAKAIAARAMGINASARACWLVRRLDNGQPYFLVLLGNELESGAIVAVDQAEGSVLNSAKVERMPARWLPTRSRAIELANLEPPSIAELVWQPARISRSPLYPFWRITNATATRYVDHAGTVS